VLSSALLLHLTQLSSHHIVLHTDQLMGHLQFTVKLLSAELCCCLAAQEFGSCLRDMAQEKMNGGQGYVLACDRGKEKGKSCHTHVGAQAVGE